MDKKLESNSYLSTYLSTVHMKRVPNQNINGMNVKQNPCIILTHICTLKFSTRVIRHNMIVVTSGCLTEAPNAKAAANPRPSATPPEAMYGMSSS